MTKIATESAQTEIIQAMNDAAGAPAPAPEAQADMLSLSTVVAELRGFADDIAESWGRLSREDRAQIQRVVGELGRVSTDRSGCPPPTNRLPVPAPGQGWMFAVGIVLAVSWLVVFAVGFSVPTAPHLETLDATHLEATSARTVLKTIVIVIFCSTPTNPGILACLAALLGGISSWIHVDGTATSESDRTASLQRICFAPMLRGFFMYLSLLAGLLLLTTQAITNATQDQYVQLAGTVSVFAFMIGYDPNVFRKLMGRVNGWAVQREERATLDQASATAERSGAVRQPNEREAPRSFDVDPPKEPTGGGNQRSSPLRQNAIP